MNLENLGVQEMDAQDVRNIDGGYAPTGFGIYTGFGRLFAESIMGMYQMGYDAAMSVQ